MAIEVDQQRVGFGSGGFDLGIAEMTKVELGSAGSL